MDEANIAPAVPVYEQISLCAKGLLAKGVNIGIEQLAMAKDLRVYCTDAFPEYGVYLFTFDCSLGGKRLHFVNLRKSIMVVHNKSPQKAHKIAEDGLIKTQELARRYMEGERLSGNEGLVATVH